MRKLKITRVGVMVKPNSSLALQALLRITSWGKDRGVKVALDGAAARILRDGAVGMPNNRLFRMIDALVILGGDGTFLGAARQATNFSIPLLGVNLGSLGFMTEVALDEIEHALDELLDGSYVIEERIMLDLNIENGRKKRSEVALNEAVFSRKSMAKMIELSIWVNGQYVTRYKADGLIVSTPTGSTAYALSAGGPILFPTLDALLICPICPHTLTNRPVVVPAGDTVEIEILKDQEEVIVTLDGQICIDLNPLDRLILCRSSKTTKIIKVPDSTHFDTLRNKLGWGGSSSIVEKNG